MNTVDCKVCTDTTTISPSETEGCPFRLLCDRQTKGPDGSGCGDCGGITDRSLARYRYLASRLLRFAEPGEPQRVDDAVNEFVLDMAASRLAERYDERRGTEAAFGKGIFRHTCHKLARKARRPALPPQRVRAASGERDPSELAATGELQQIVRAAIARLPSRYRMALCREYGIPDPDAATAGWPELSGACKDMVLFRARRRLRDLLRAQWPDIEQWL